MTTLSIDSPRFHENRTHKIVPVQSVRVGDFLVDKLNKMQSIGKVLELVKKTNASGNEYIATIVCENGTVSHKRKSNSLYKVV